MPLLLAKLTKDQIVRVAKVVYDFDLDGGPNITKTTLVGDVAKVMEASEGCGCAGPDLGAPPSTHGPPAQLPCTPDTHYFDPAVYLATGVDTGDVLDSLNSVPQVDGPAAAQGQDFLSPEALPTVHDHPADTAGQRQQVLDEAAALLATQEMEAAAARQRQARDILNSRHGLSVSVPGFPATSGTALQQAGGIPSITDLVGAGGDLVLSQVPSSTTGTGVRQGLLSPGHFGNTSAPSSQPAPHYPAHYTAASSSSGQDIPALRHRPLFSSGSSGGGVTSGSSPRPITSPYQGQPRMGSQSLPAVSQAVTAASSSSLVTGLQQTAQLPLLSQPQQFVPPSQVSQPLPLSQAQHFPQSQQAQALHLQQNHVQNQLLQHQQQQQLQQQQHQQQQQQQQLQQQLFLLQQQQQQQPQQQQWQQLSSLVQPPLLNVPVAGQQLPHLVQPPPLNVPVAGAHPPGQATDVQSTLAVMLARMEIDKKEERLLREKELENQRGMMAILAGRLAEPASGGSGAASAIADVLHPSRGRIGIIPSVNPAAEREVGSTLTPLYSLVGDLSTIDMTHAKHKLKSGMRPAEQDEVLITERWPNQFIPRMLVGGKKVDHPDLDQVKMAYGFIAKAYTEAPVELMGTPLINKLRIFMSLFKIAIVSPWADVLAINQALFQALERRAVSWDSWSELDLWWQQTIDMLRTTQSGARAHGGSGQTQSAPKRPAETPAGAAPPAKAQKRTIMGVPSEWLRQQHLCIKFNLGRCQTPAPHISTDKSGDMLRHLCGGCLHLKKGQDGGHGMDSCPNKPASGVFV